MKRHFATLFTIGALALSLSACSSSDELSIDNSGDIPKIVFPDSGPPADLQVIVLEEGDGPEITKDDSINVDYVGTIWGSDEPFDSSYSRSTTLTVSLAQLVPGWSKGLAGCHVGDKLLLSLPPEEGYGKEGNPDAGISGTDTIVFYVDIHHAWNVNVAGQKDATVELHDSDLPLSTTAGIGEPITFASVKEGAAEPTKNNIRVIARGTGGKVGANDTVFYQIFQAYWDNSAYMTTWGNDVGVQSAPIGSGSVLDDLAGIPVGSRVLLEIPADKAKNTPSIAIIMDIIDTDSSS